MNWRGDSLIGRRLYPLLARAGYRDVKVSPRMVYADASRRALVDGFTRKTFTAILAVAAWPTSAADPAAAREQAATDAGA